MGSRENPLTGHTENTEIPRINRQAAILCYILCVPRELRERSFQINPMSGDVRCGR